MRAILLAAAGTSILAAAAASPGFAQEPAERVFTGGTIYTGLEGPATAEMVAVEDGRIVYAGSAEDGEAYVGETTETVDLDGAVMFPGFTDAHAHLIGIGQRERTLNLETVDSIAALQAALAEAAEDDSLTVIAGRGWIETHWPEDRFPNAADLDAAEAERPVILIRADGHALVANTAAMEAVGIDADTPDPEGGEIERDEDGAATGIMIDAAMAGFEALIGEPEGEERADIYAAGAEVYAASGWTGIHDMSVNYADVEVMTDLAEDGRLPLRAYVSANPGDYDAVAAAAPRSEADGRVQARAVKLYADGALGSRGAALIEPYEDAPDSDGLFLMRRDAAIAMMEDALRDGVQLAIHAIGDMGNRQTLDWIEAAFDAVPEDERAVADPRWRIEHAQILHPDDLPRFAELGVIASMQPSHAIGDLHFAERRLGLHRLEGAYAWRDLVESGAIIAGGSDAPVERGEARIEFYAAAVRRDLDGYADPQTWNLDQALDRETALKLFTIWPAYASFREDELGTIEAGKIADFSVFDRDLMTVSDEDLVDAAPVMTVIDGEVVWRAD